MLSTIQKTPIMKPGGDMKNIADEIILAQSAFVLYNSENLCASDSVLHLDMRFRYLGVGRFLLFRQFLPFWLLHRLQYGDIVRSIPLIPGILLKDALVWKGILDVRNLLVMYLSLNGESGKEDKSCKASDYSVLYRVLLFLPAVVFLLQIGIGWSGNLPLRAVVDKLMHHISATTLVKKTLEPRHCVGWEHSGFIKSHPENVGKGMDPLATLLLTHIEHCRMILLRGIVLEISQKKEKTVCNRRKLTVGLDDMTTLAGQPLALYVVPSEVFIMRINKKGKISSKRYILTLVSARNEVGL